MTDAASSLVQHLAMGEEDTQTGKFLTFVIGSEAYGLEIRHVTEIIGLQKITVLPDMPDFLKGVINLRGKVIPIMDFRARFKLAPRDYDDRTCVIVVEVKNASVGLVVDTVSEVVEIPEPSIQPVPKLGTQQGSRFMKGLGRIGTEVKILLDAERLLFDQELDAIDALKAGTLESAAA